MDDGIGNYGGRLIVAMAGVGIALVAFYLVMRFIRNRGGPLPFFRSGRGQRDTRLQILDTTAVDARRRLVLVRRDNVEHLIMIGGPTDVVIESRIVAEGDADDGDYDPGVLDRHEDYANIDEDVFEDEAPPPLSSPPPGRPAISPAQAWRSLAEAREPLEREAPVSSSFAPPASPPRMPEASALPQPSAAKTRPKAAAITEQMNDFEKMLEAEMAARLEAGRDRRAASVPARPASSPRQAAKPVAANAASAANTDQTAMQRQMARIFGDDNV